MGRKKLPPGRLREKPLRIRLNAEDRQFVITAAHVADELIPGVSLVTFPNAAQPLYSTRLHVVGTHKHGSSDIAVIELANLLPQSQCDEDHCVRMSELSQHPDVHELTFLVHGFPSDSQAVSPMMPGVLQVTHVLVPTNYREMSDDWYGEHHEYRGPTIILEYGPEIWQRYHMAYFSGFGDSHRPSGLSGGGVWYAKMKHGEQLLVPADVLKLVGIQSHWVENNYLRVVPITEALEVIDRDVLGIAS